ncbi:hypothetical protein AGMMS50276_14590 [Synergistales bacterium]|nr:hypothetical protein AGMMS50276_14590 [Synergistales bacterium]
MKKNEKVLIWTRAYNAEKTIERTIESIINQTHTDWIYYVADNGSTDRTREIISQYAKRDARIQILVSKVNSLVLNRKRYLPVILRNREDAGWLCYIDADDEYLPDFMEKMLGFVIENNLDIASCGYDRVDDATGKFLERRELGYNLILEGRKFAEEFINYRKYTIFGWAKFISMDFFRKASKYRRGYKYNTRGAKAPKWHLNYLDTMEAMNLFRRAKRAGVYRESLHRHYQYNKSLVRMFAPNRVKNDEIAFKYHRTYLRAVGGGVISKINYDFLYAIHLSLLEETLSVIYNANISLPEKLKNIALMFKNKTTQDMLARDADPQFRNLAARGEFLQRVADWIFAQDEWKEHREIIAEIITSMTENFAYQFTLLKKANVLPLTEQ